MSLFCKGVHDNVFCETHLNVRLLLMRTIPRNDPQKVLLSRPSSCQSSSPSCAR